MIKIFVSIFFLAFTYYAEGQSRKPVNVIFDTDIGPDYDDVGAITLLHALADSGKANILATVASSKYPNVAAVLNVFNTYFRRPEILIGVPKTDAVTDADVQHWSDTLIAKYPHKIKSNNEADDAVAVYRKVLSLQPDNSVTIVTVGFLTNLANLLTSSADQYSKLSGRDLVKKKVKHLVCMAGGFPSGREFNIHKDAKAGKYTFDNWPTSITFSGFEIGKKIKTGIPLISNEAIHDSPAKDAFAISIPQSKEDSNGRMSWDQTAVLVAINGAKPYYDLIPGKIITNADGSNTWDDTKKGHYYLIEKMAINDVTKIINDLMMHQPKK